MRSYRKALVMFSAACISINSLGIDFSKIPEASQTRPILEDVQRVLTKEFLFDILEKKFNSQQSLSDKYQSLKWPIGVHSRNFLWFDVSGKPKNIGPSSQNTFSSADICLNTEFVFNSVLKNSYGSQLSSLSSPARKEFEQFVSDLVIYYEECAYRNDTGDKRSLERINEHLRNWKAGKIDVDNERFSASEIQRVMEPVLAFADDYDKFVEQLTNKLKTQNQVAEKQEKVQQVASEKSEKIFILGLFVLIGLLLVGVFLGSTDRAVFYMDGSDLFLSFVPYIVMLFAAFLSAAVAEWWFYAGLFVSALTIVFIVYKSFQYNRGVFAALVTAYAKIVLSVVICVQVLKLFEKETSGRGKVVKQMIIISFLTGLMTHLVNGNRVLSSRQDDKEAGE